MSESEFQHRHLDDEQIDELARATISGLDVPLTIEDCPDCEARVFAHGRYLSLARLITRDTQQPMATPAVEAVRAIRRQSYRRRAIGEITAILTTSPLTSSSLTSSSLKRRG